jgi:hypothetical protein
MRSSYLPKSLQALFFTAALMLMLGCGPLSQLAPTQTPYPTYTPFPSPTNAANEARPEEESSPAAQFVGQWENEDPGNAHVARAKIELLNEDEISVHMWGACTPTDCDWGEETIDISDANDEVLTIAWTTSFSEISQELSVLPDGRLVVTTHTHYTDDSGRPDRDVSELFVKK